MHEDIFRLLQWWGMLVVIGLGVLPITTRLFSSFFDKGYALSKILGVILGSYLVFLFGSLRLIPFTVIGVYTLFFILIVSQLFFIKTVRHLSFLSSWRQYLPIFLIEELLFLLVLGLWTYIRGFAPEINGLEKFMDYGFINSILRSEYFPPKDMWLTPFTINYYYFGHLTTAVLTKASLLPSHDTYNLMLATLAALTFTASVSIGGTLYSFIQNKKRRLYNIIVAGLLSALLVTFSGNLHTIYTFFKPYENERPVPFWELPFSLYNPCYQQESYTVQTKNGSETISCSREEQQKYLAYPNAYWYPNATRFIKNTIHEFPIYSWVVADLHGHVFDVPFVLFTIAFLLSLFITYTSRSIRKEKVSKKKVTGFRILLQRISHEVPLPLSSLFFISFLLSIMYMTNAWDGIIYFLLSLMIIAYLEWQTIQKNGYTLNKIFQLLLEMMIPLFVLGGGFILFSLPFSLFFKPFVSGIGVICAPEFLTNIRTLGPFLFEQDHCDRSPWWQLLVLYGFFLFFITAFVIFLKNTKARIKSDAFILFLIPLSLFLILIPEVLYAKDIYPAHYRANTMFKLAFQAFIMLSLTSGYIIARLAHTLKRITTVKGLILYAVFFLASFLLLFLVFLYPYFAINSYYHNVFAFRDRLSPPPPEYKGINGIMYLKERYPDDFAAVYWIQEHIQGQPVILEAQGDSYTDYARISANTGLPTILGWTVHEWLWRGTYDVPAPRIEDVRKLYESDDLEETKLLLQRYNVAYVFLGELEKDKYPNLNSKKFERLGEKVFQRGNTIIYKIKPLS